MTKTAKPLDEWRREARRFSVRGNEIAYWTSDDNPARPALLLIHGYPTSSWDWTYVWPALAAHFRLIALDMLGFGLSDKPPGASYAIADQADLQEALLVHLGDSAAHVLAHDYGDTVGQELLAREREGRLKFSLRSMIFLNGGLFPEQHRARPIQKLGLTPLGFLLGALMTRASFARTLNTVFGPATKADAAELDAYWALINEKKGRRVLHRLLSYIPQRRANRERWVGALLETRVPIALIDGGADPVSGEHLYHYFQSLAPNADAVLLKEIGHYPQTEAPDEVVRNVLEFHRKLEGRAA